MAIITHIENPFNPINSRSVVLKDGGSPLYSYFNEINNSYDVVVSVNGQIEEDFNYNVLQNDSIAFVAIPQGGGGGKDILRSVAMIALVVGAPYAAAGVIGATGALGGLAIGYGGYTAVLAGVMIGGGLLINTLMPPATPDFSNPSFGEGYKNSSTYSWGATTNSTQEGMSIPVIYGAARITPPLISQYVETVGNKQYLNMLFAINDGEVTSITDIYINKNPIAYYNNVTYETRTGTNNQSLISSFDNTRVDTAVGAILSDASYVTRQGTGNTTNEITISISAPQGLYYANDAGGLDTVEVPLIIEYRAVGDSTWLEFVASPTMSAVQNSTYRATFTKDSLTPDQYEVRVKRTTAQSTSSRTADKVYFEAFTEVVYDDFTYPNTALLSVRALATDQLNGTRPTVTALVSANSDNPSLIVQNILTAWAGVDSANIATDEFLEFETFCNTNDYTCNIVFDTAVDIKQAMDTVSQLGRAIIVRMGAVYLPIVDKVGEIPTQGFLFTMGNIIENSFSTEYLPTIDRSNVVEVTYFDETLDYERQPIELHQIGFDENVSEIKKASIALYGCTDRDMATRHGRYLLNKAQYLTTTVSFDVALDAIACRMGDIISVAHDLPQWGYSGRIASFEYSGVYETGVYEADVYSEFTIDALVLDKEITMLDDSTSYGIQLRISETDNIINKSVVVPSGGYTGDTITLVGAFTTDPSKYDVYSFGEINKITKEFTVLNITRSSDQLRKITAIEYIEEVYSDSGDSIPVVNKSSLSTVSNLLVTPEYTTDINGISSSVVNLSWQGSDISWNVYSRLQGDSEWTLEGVSTNSVFRVDNLKAGSYDFRVGALVVSITVDALPTAPSITSVTPTPKYTGVQFQITYTPFDDFSHIEVWEASLAQTINDAVLIATTDKTIYQRYGLLVTDSRNYWFRIVDVYGNTGDFYGEVVGTTSTDITAIILAMKNVHGTEEYQPQLADILTTGTVGGVATLGVSGNLLVDGTISALQITAETITADEIAAGTITSTEMSTNVLLIGGEVESSNYDWNSGTPIGFGMWSTGEGGSGEAYNIVGGKIFGTSLDGTTLNIQDINIKDSSGNSVAASFGGNTSPMAIDLGDNTIILTSGIKTTGNLPFNLLQGQGYLSISNTFNPEAFNFGAYIAGYSFLFASNSMTSIALAIKDGSTTRASGTVSGASTIIGGMEFKLVYDNSWSKDYQVYIKETHIPDVVLSTGLGLEFTFLGSSYDITTIPLTWLVSNI